MEKEKNVMKMVTYYLKENIFMEKNLKEKLKNMIKKCSDDIWRRTFKLWKNGKGIEYNPWWDWNGYILIKIFEDDYLRGKRNGKGKEYGEFGNIIFEGEYLLEMYSLMTLFII